LNGLGIKEEGRGEGEGGMGGVLLQATALDWSDRLIGVMPRSPRSQHFKGPLGLNIQYSMAGSRASKIQRLFFSVAGTFPHSGVMVFVV